MNVGDCLPKEFSNLKGADFFTHGHLPVAAAYCRRLGLIEIVNQMVPSQMHLSPGLVVQAMVLDTLSGRTPLYHIEDFMAEQDIELLLGTAVLAAQFNDTNLARSLDAIFEAGPSKIVTALGVRATQEFALDTSAVSHDTTSTSVWGDFGMILVIALMVYRLMERTMRARLKEANKVLIGWEKRITDKPTAFMMTTVMVGILVVSVAGKRFFFKPPHSRQVDYLFALGLTTEVFLNPSIKCQPKISQFVSGDG